jgi:hypothetical protein
MERDMAATPHIIVFADVNCQGEHIHVCEGYNHLGPFNDKASSFVILEGNWQFFADVDLQGQMGGVGRTLGPGVYNWIETALGPGTNDRLTSIKPV